MFTRPIFVALLWLACAGEAPAADSLRCGSRLISVEALAAELLAACGEPSFRDVFAYVGPQGLRERFPGDAGSNVIADDEQWTYDFGPNQLLRVLKIRNGRLVSIDSDGYGFHAASDRRCQSNDIAQGLSKYRLLKICGEPFTRRYLGLVQSLQQRNRSRLGGSLGGHRGYGRSADFFPVEVYREEWVYNFGSRNFLRVVTLEDGVVANVDNGERGSDLR